MTPALHKFCFPCSQLNRRVIDDTRTAQNPPASSDGGEMKPASSDEGVSKPASSDGRELKPASSDGRELLPASSDGRELNPGVAAEEQRSPEQGKVVLSRVEQSTCVQSNEQRQHGSSHALQRKGLQGTQLEVTQATQREGSHRDRVLAPRDSSQALQREGLQGTQLEVTQATQHGSLQGAQYGTDTQRGTDTDTQHGRDTQHGPHGSFQDLSQCGGLHALKLDGAHASQQQSSEAAHQKGWTQQTCIAHVGAELGSVPVGRDAGNGSRLGAVGPFGLTLKHPR